MQNDDYPFKPRGIIKWHAFAAVISGDEQKESARTIEELEVDLLEDNLALLDVTLKQAIEDHDLVNIKYLEDNEIKNIETIITKIDTYKMNIICEDITLPVKQTLDITIIN